MRIFSFRAECQEDVEQFHRACAQAGLITMMTATPYLAGPDVQVELAAKASLEVLRDAARRVPDAHVIWQTLRECALAENSLERDRSLH